MALGGLAARRAAAAAAGGGAAPSLAGRAGPSMGLGGMGGGPPPTGMAGRLRRPGQGLTLSSMGGGAGPGIGASDAPFSSFKGIVDPSGRLNFQSKAVLHADGVDFTNGPSYKINKDEMELQEELGKGNYGSVQKVYHKPTKVVMAMKVSPRVAIIRWSGTDVLAGNPSRTRRIKTQRHHHGTRYSSSRRRPRNRRILRRIHD